MSDVAEAVEEVPWVQHIDLGYRSFKIEVPRHAEYATRVILHMHVSDPFKAWVMLWRELGNAIWWAAKDKS